MPGAPPVQPSRPGPLSTSSGRWIVAVIVALGLTAVALAAVAGRLPGAPDSEPVERLTLLLLLVLSGFLGLEFRARGEGDRLDLFDAALATALISLPGPEVLVLVVLAKGLTLTVQRVPAVKICFNVAQWGCASAAGSLVYVALRGPGPTALRDLVLLAVALLTVVLVNAGSVLLVLVTVGGSSVLRVSSRGLVHGTAVSTPLNLGLGVAFAALWALAPGSRSVIPVALVAVHLGTRGWAQRQAGTSRLVGLQRASAVLARASDVPAGLPAFLDELRAAFACGGVEVHLRLGPDLTWIRQTSGDDVGADRTAALVGELLHREVAVRLAPAVGDAELQRLMAVAGWRDCLASPVHFEGQVVGLLCTHDREGWEGFESAELSVLQAAAGVLGDGIHRGELADVLRKERAALQAAEIRWRFTASMLELADSSMPLPQALDILTRNVEEQTGARCAVLVDAPGRPVTVTAPSLSAGIATLEELLRPVMSLSAESSGPWLWDLSSHPAGLTVPNPFHDTDLARMGVRRMRAWAMPYAPGSGATGVLALCYPETTRLPQHDQLGADAARVGGLAVGHLLAQQRLAHQAAHDPLTDLPNRTVFLDRLGGALRATQRGSSWVLVLFLDLDRFKVVNDSLGHRAGDALLRSVAERLRTAVRPGDTVARFGGDEFTMLCTDIQDDAHALRVVQRVQQVLERPFPLGDSELFATTSIGIALGRGTAQSPERLVEDADAAMYRAKERGGNCFDLYDADMRNRAVQRLDVQSALHRGLEREEFRVVYQPTVRLSTGRVEGVEALVRWARPEHGMVQPGDFVPLAEETGLIVPIGAYVLEQACRQAALWRDASPGSAAPSISVNLSARQLTDPGLLALVTGAIEGSNMDPSTVSLEITESVLMEDVAASEYMLCALKALGVRLYVDDFGTGYSSLTYLQRFPVDGLKVDRSFVAGLGSQADAAAIVRAVIGLAHGLGLVAIAEGVETRDQLDHLIDLDCDIAQGYHFGRPVPADQISLSGTDRAAALRGARA